MADLPPERCSPAPPFTNSGVDLFGPFMVKNGRKREKRYGVVFTCLASRSVHLEVCSSLETDSFIQALRRFEARRGPVVQLRCDNATNFRGAQRELSNALKEMDDDDLKRKLSQFQIEWLYNPPFASHMGGIWERQIRSVRKTLAFLADSVNCELSDESLNTLLCETEFIINSRPLTTPSSDVNDLPPLTPNSLLTQKSTFLPPPGNFSDGHARKQWRRVQYLANIFWDRWKREFLLCLQSRNKWVSPTRNISVGDIIVLSCDDVHRYHWPLGKVVKCITDSSGVVRSVDVRTAKSVFRRPVTRIVLLVPVEEQD